MIWIGTSGYNYPEWKGSFYPADLATAKMLPYYAARFPTVEINYTFYRMPNEKLVAGWAAQTPSPYKLTLKAPRRITHDSRLKNCGALVATLLRGRRHARRQARRAAVPAAAEPEEGSRAVRRVSRRAAAEGVRRVRVPPSVVAGRGDLFARLAARNLALCVADSEKLSTPVRVTADYAYFRLRDEGYTPDDIKRWADTIARETASCRDVFVYFKHEEEGKGPEFAQLLMSIWDRICARDDGHDDRTVRHRENGRPAHDVAVSSGARQPARARSPAPPAPARP